MKGAVAAQYFVLTLDQKSGKYFCKHTKIKLCRQTQEKLGNTQAILFLNIASNQE